MHRDIHILPPLPRSQPQKAGVRTFHRLRTVSRSDPAAAVFGSVAPRTCYHQHTQHNTYYYTASIVGLCCARSFSRVFASRALVAEREKEKEKEKEISISISISISIEKSRR